MYDLVIRGGRVIDPAQGIDGPRDVAFKDGKVAALEATIEAGAAREVISAAGKLVVPGLIDMGIGKAGAHLFIMYFGMMSMVTPPVCFAAFAACRLRFSPFSVIRLFPHIV